jgi:hypothetical protein
MATKSLPFFIASLTLTLTLTWGATPGMVNLARLTARVPTVRGGRRIQYAIILTKARACIRAPPRTRNVEQELWNRARFHNALVLQRCEKRASEYGCYSML